MEKRDHGMALQQSFPRRHQSEGRDREHDIDSEPAEKILEHLGNGKLQRKALPAIIAGSDIVNG